MGTLTLEQEDQLRDTQQELNDLTTPALIYEAMRLRAPDPPLSESQKKQLRRAYGGVIAAVKIQAYLESMRQANLRRLRIGETMKALNEEVRERRATDPLSVIGPAIEIPLLSGLQEIEVHTFVIAVNALHTLLPIAARASSHTIPNAVLESLRPYVNLRDYYEHLDQRVPGAAHKHGMQAFTEVDNEEGLRFIFGLPVDSVTGEIILDGQRIDVSSRAVDKVQKIAADAWLGIRQDVLKHVDEFFRKHPERIPDPRSVDTKFEIRVAGPLQQVPMLHDSDRRLYEEVRGIFAPVTLPLYDFSRPNEKL